MGSSLRSNVASILKEIPIDFGGGCSFSKAYLMAYLIRRYDMKKTLDIGVYRGRSLFPQAQAHASFTGGMVYGVDPWDVSEAVEHDNTEHRNEIETWAANTDFQSIYEEVESLIGKFSFSDHCKLVRQTSEDAISYFRDRSIFFDMIHIDGNHDTQKVMNDLTWYLPRLTQNGFIVIDDISWESVKPAYDYLSRKMSHVFENTGEVENDYAVFWKNNNAVKKILLSRKLKDIGLGKDDD